MSDVIRQLEARSNFGNQQITRGLSEVPGSVTVRRASIWKRPRLRVKAAKWDSSASISCHGGDNGQLPPDGGSTVFWEDPEDDRRAIRIFACDLCHKLCYSRSLLSRVRLKQPCICMSQLLSCRAREQCCHSHFLPSIMDSPAPFTASLCPPGCKPEA